MHFYLINLGRGFVNSATWSNNNIKLFADVLRKSRRVTSKIFGFYTHKYLNYNYLFYVSALIMGVGSFLIIYGTLFLKNNDGN